MATIYRAKYVIPIGVDIIKDGEVLVEGGRICEVGRDISVRYPRVHVRDLGRAALLPGFVNAHSHIDYTLSRNQYDGLNLWDWIHKVGFRKGKTPEYDLILASARLGATLCACSGITCVGDCSFSGAAVEALSDLGLRAVVYKEIFGQSMGDDYPEKFAHAVDEVSSLRAKAGMRIRIGLSPHAVYTSSAVVLKLCAKTCSELHMPISMHLAETSAEGDYTHAGTGPIADWRRELGYEPMVSGVSPTEVLFQAGLLQKGVSLAHCVHISKDDVELIGRSGVSVVHCPRSNARLGAGVAPIPALRDAGAVVGLGTDSAASCGELDFFDEMRFALGVHRARSEDAEVLLAKDVLEMATSGGAASLGIEDVGKLEPGMRADMIAVDVGGMLPGEDVHLAVISRSPADIVLTIVDGEPVEADLEARTRELRDLMELCNFA